MFEWDARKVYFRIDSARHSHFHEQIAGLIAARVDRPEQASICDAGCGLGFLSLALTQHFDKVTAIDISPIALATLRAEADSRRLTNLAIVREDLLGDADVHPQSYDTMVFSFFGNIEEILHIALPRCRDTIFILKKNDHHHRFSVSHAMRPYDSMAAALHDLNERHIPFTKEDMSIEDGQPLRNLEEAEEFFHLYARGEDEALIDREYIRSLLTETGDESFPYYFPRACDFSLLSVDLSSCGGDLP